jgi:hypothetical protein
VKYEYVVLVKKGANIQDILSAVEKGTHMAFTSELLVCDFTRRMLKENYGYTTAYSAPLDKANPNKACVNPPDPTIQDCCIVNGAATFEHLPGSPDSALLENQVGAILIDSYHGGGLDNVHDDLVRLNFVSFIEETTTGTDTTGENDPAGGDPVGVVVGTGADRSASPGTIGGSVAIAIAAVGLVLIGLLIFRRRGSQFMHMETLDDKDTLVEDGDFSTGSDDETSYMHLERQFDLAQFEPNMTHDPKTCDSVERGMTLQPVLVDTNLDMTVSYRPERLSHTTFQRYNNVPNTVEL